MASVPGDERLRHGDASLCMREACMAAGSVVALIGNEARPHGSRCLRLFGVVYTDA